MHPTIVIKTSIDWILKYDFFVGNFILIDDEIIRDASPQAYNLNKKNTVFF